MFTARVPQIIAQILVSPRTEVLLYTPAQPKGKSQQFTFLGYLYTEAGVHPAPLHPLMGYLHEQATALF